MSSKFLTPLILSSALTLGALSFIACGDDANPGIPPTGTTSSSSGFVAPTSIQSTELTAIVFNDMGVSSTGLTKVKFKGSITLDLSDSNTVADINAVRFTNIMFEIVNKNMTSNGKAETIVPLDFENQALTTVNLAEVGLFTNLDENYSECGDFLLIITAIATDGQIQSVSKDTIQFERPEEKCKIPESSSSEAIVPGAPLDTISIKVNTKTDKCLSIATGLASADATGDICFKTVGSAGSVQLSSTTGLKFAVYSNTSNDTRLDDWSKNYLPDNPTTDSFLYLDGSLKEVFPDFLNEVDVFFVAIGPKYVRNSGSATDFYAFVVSELGTADTNGDISFTLLVYKAK
ncbi:MAG: hypothetical protein IKS96_12260 [Fibrobacter sp.]|nr:hypothetical protein [Fibrobacter sp.]